MDRASGKSRNGYLISIHTTLGICVYELIKSHSQSCEMHVQLFESHGLHPKLEGLIPNFHPDP